MLRLQRGGMCMLLPEVIRQNANVKAFPSLAALGYPSSIATLFFFNPVLAGFTTVIDTCRHKMSNGTCTSSICFLTVFSTVAYFS